MTRVIRNNAEKHDDVSLEAAAVARKVSRRRHTLAVWLIRAMVVLIPVGIWAAATSTGGWSPLTFGSPQSIGSLLWDWATHGYIYSQILQTLKEVVYGFVIGAALGVLIAILLALSRKTLWPIFNPYLIAGNAIPRVVLAPIFGLWFGFGTTSKVFLVVVMVFFVIFFNVFAGLSNVDPTMLESAQCLGATKLQLVRHVYLPSALVWLLASLRITLGFAFLAAIIGEYVAANSGIGFVIAQGTALGSVDQIMGGILVILIITIPLQYLLEVVDRYVQRWRPNMA